MTVDRRDFGDQPARILTPEDQRIINRNRKIAAGVASTVLIVACLGMVGATIYVSKASDAQQKEYQDTHYISLDNVPEINGLKLIQYTPREVLIRPHAEGFTINYLDKGTQTVIQKIDKVCKIEGPLPTEYYVNGTGSGDIVTLPIHTKVENCVDLIVHG